MRGEILYSSLRIKHIPFVRDEIIFRGENYDRKWSIKKLKEKLKEIDLDRQKSLIIHDRGNRNTKSSEFNEKSFLPLHRNADEYDDIMDL